MSSEEDNSFPPGSYAMMIGSCAVPPLNDGETEAGEWVNCDDMINLPTIFGSDGFRVGEITHARKDRSGVIQVVGKIDMNSKYGPTAVNSILKGNCNDMGLVYDCIIDSHTTQVKSRKLKHVVISWELDRNTSESSVRIIHKDEDKEN